MFDPHSYDQDVSETGKMEFLFLGTGTSAGVPMIGCHCSVCHSSDPKDNRTRCSAVVSHTDAAGVRRRVLIDTTPELRLQAVGNKVDAIDAVVFTHGHADHLMGLDDLRRFNAVKKGPLDVWVDDNTWKIMQPCFGYAFQEPNPALKVFRPNLVRRQITAEPFDLHGLVWQPIPLMHGDMPVLGFRIGKLAYCTDVSHIPADSMEKLYGLDVLVIDALEHKPHPTHFSIEQAIEVVRELRPRRALFTHIAHSVSHAGTSARLPEGIELAYDGLKVFCE